MKLLASNKDKHLCTLSTLRNAATFCFAPRSQKGNPMEFNTFSKDQAS